MKLKKSFVVIAASLGLIGLSACTQADRASYNLAKEADSFNVVRKVTVLNAISNDVMFEMTGKMSITADTEEQQLEIVVEDGNKNYQKHIIGLSDNVSYVVQDIDSKNVSNYKYTINFNPKMWIPVDAGNID